VLQGWGCRCVGEQLDASSLVSWREHFIGSEVPAEGPGLGTSRAKPPLQLGLPSAPTWDGLTDPYHRRSVAPSKEVRMKPRSPRGGSSCGFSNARFALSVSPPPATPLGIAALANLPRGSCEEGSRDGPRKCRSVVSRAFNPAGGHWADRRLRSLQTLSVSGVGPAPVGTRRVRNVVCLASQRRACGGRAKKRLMARDRDPSLHRQAGQEIR